jgi:hypothetical protein
MKLKNIAFFGLVASAVTLSGCGQAANTTNTTNTTNANKPAAANTNTNKPSSNSNTNATANTNSSAKVDGDVVNIDDAGITMVVPKGFKFSKDGEDIIVKTEDEGVDVRFTVPKDGDYAKVLTAAAQEIDDYLTDVKVEDKGSKVDVNGMEATSMSGTATNEGEAVSWDLTIINAPKKPVLVNIYAAKSSMEKHGADVKKFLESVKKM